MAKKNKTKKPKAKNNELLFPVTIKCATCGKETDNHVEDVYCSEECRMYLPF